MYGQNDISSPRRATEGFTINEIFYTIQGEGPWAGRPAVFVRFADCNLRCRFCDTDFTRKEVLSQEELIERITDICLKNACTRIVLTGGEPMLQDLTSLIMGMPEYPMYYFQIETAGTVWPVRFEEAFKNHPIMVVCSPKTPKIHDRVVAHTSAWKYIIEAGKLDPMDGLPVGSTQTDAPAAKHIYRAKRWANTIYVQPCDSPDAAVREANVQAAVTSAMAHGYTLSLQVHKIVGLP